MMHILNGSNSGKKLAPAAFTLFSGNRRAGLSDLSEKGRPTAASVCIGLTEDSRKKVGQQHQAEGKTDQKELAPCAVLASPESATVTGSIAIISRVSVALISLAHDLL
jgi:hypothetical protein